MDSNDEEALSSDASEGYEDADDEYAMASPTGAGSKGGGRGLDGVGGASGGGGEEEEYKYEVLTADEIVQHMVDCIRDVNTVVQVSAATQRRR